MLRKCVVLALAAATLAIPAAARANTAPACLITPVSTQSAEAARLDRLVTTGLGQAVEPALGDQYAGAWLKLTEGTWYAGVAPGALDLAAAQVKLGELIASRLQGDDAAFVTERLCVVAEPYSWPELRAVQTQLWTELGADSTSIGVAAGIGCATSDAWRVEVTYFSDSPD